MLGLRGRHNESQTMRAAALFPAFALVAVTAACSKPKPPVGKWEGGMERGGTLVVARVEILPGGLVRGDGARHHQPDGTARADSNAIATGWRRTCVQWLERRSRRASSNSTARPSASRAGSRRRWCGQGHQPDGAAALYRRQPGAASAAAPGGGVSRQSVGDTADAFHVLALTRLRREKDRVQR